MKHEIPSPITDENFNQAWDYANRKLIEIKKKELIRKILVFVANIIFFVCATTFLLFLLTQLSSTTVHAFIDTLGPLKTMIAIATPMISHPKLHIIVQILIYLAFLFVPAFLASGIVTLIVWFVYQPSKPNTATEDKAADSKTLVDALFEAKIRGKKVDGITSMVAAAVFIIELLALSLGLVIFVVNNPESLSNDPFITQTLPTLVQSPIFIGLLSGGQNTLGVMFIATYGIYIALNEILSNLLKPFYKTKLDSTIQQDAKNYYYECNPAIKAEYEEEEHILQRAIEIKAKRRQEENELLEKINYKNPIYKYIKIGILTLVLIIGLVFAGNKLKSFDIEKFLNELGIEFMEGSTESTETESGTEVNHE